MYPRLNIEVDNLSKGFVVGFLVGIFAALLILA